MLKELFRNSLELTKTNLILVQPLLIFMFISGFFFQSVIPFDSHNPAKIVMLIAIFALFSAFLAGWFYMFHKCIEFSDKNVENPTERAELSLSIFKEFTPGVGKYFPKMTLGLILYSLLSLGLFYLLWIVGQNYIQASDNLSIGTILDAMVNQDKAIAFVESLSDADKAIIQKWNWMVIAATSLFSYFTMFWPVAIVVKDENAFLALLTSIKVVVKNPVITIAIYGSFYFSSLFITVINAFGGSNLLMQLITLMTSVLLTVYFLVVMFLYFEKNYESNSSSWTDSFR